MRLCKLNSAELHFFLDAAQKETTKKLKLQEVISLRGMGNKEKLKEKKKERKTERERERERERE